MKPQALKLSLNLTTPLLRWLQEAPAWAGLDWRVRASLHWRARWGSLNLRQSRALVQGPAGEVEPLLILGPWRSGTTAMHDMLSKALGWPTPLTWQCMNACTFALGGVPGAGRSVARPMDGLEVNALTPQEDEFALLTLGAPSAYQAFWMPHRLHELHHTLDPAFWLQSPQWLDDWSFFLRGVIGPAASGRILLKSPNHTFRLQAILKRYPQSRIVWMLRDPAEVYTSNLKMWQMMFEEHGLTAADPVALDRFLAAALHASAEALRWAIDHVPRERLVCCAQTDLRDQPQAVMAHVLTGLGLPPASPPNTTPAGPALQWRVDSATAPGADVPPAVRAGIEALQQAQRAAIERVS